MALRCVVGGCKTVRAGLGGSLGALVALRDRQTKPKNASRWLWLRRQSILLENRHDHHRIFAHWHQPLCPFTLQAGNMGKEDDIIPPNYQYEWTPKSDMTVQEFVAKVRLPDASCGQLPQSFTRDVVYQYKPSMVQNDGTKPVRVI